MAVVDVKITDLDKVDKIRPTDLFLIANPQFDTNGNPIPNYYYTSNSVSGDQISSFLKDAIENADLSVSGEWTVPKLRQPSRFSFDTYLEILSSDPERAAMIAMRDGRYESSEKNDLREVSPLTDSLSVLYSYVPNFDYVHRLLACVYDDVRKLKHMPSYVGEIVQNIYPDLTAMHSIYGDDTEWTRISQTAAVSLSGTDIDIKLTNKNNVKNEYQAGHEGQKEYLTNETQQNLGESRNFDIRVPLTANSIAYVQIADITSNSSAKGIVNISDKIKSLDSITFELSVVGNTNHPGNFVFGFYNGDGSLLKNYSGTFVGAETKPGEDNFGDSTDKWAFYPKTTQSGVTYGGYFSSGPQTFNLGSGQSSMQCYFRFSGKTGYSTADAYPYRCRAYVKITKIVGKKRAVDGEDDGVYTWQRTA